MKYNLFLIAHDGDGIPMSLSDWDGESVLSLPLAAFGNDAVIAIEPVIEKED